jgi:hypothetical protein
MPLPKVHWFNITEDHGIFWMFFNHLPPRKVGLAKSVDGVNFQVVNDNVLTTGWWFRKWGAWDGGLIESHQVARLKDRWRMYFGGYNGHWRISYADSFDLEHWTKRGPLLDLGKKSWESIHVADPYVIDFKGRRLMYYMGKGDVWQVGVAFVISALGQEHFVRYPLNPIIKADREWNRGCMCLSGVSVENDGLLGSVHGYDPISKKFRGYLMWSKDGFEWEEYKYLGEGIIHPEVHAVNGQPMLYYTDAEYNFQSRPL